MTTSGDLELRVDEATARAICLVRAVEEVDRTGRVLALEERRDESRPTDGPPGEWLPERSRRLATRLDALRPELGRGPRTIGPTGAIPLLGVGILAFASGLGTEALGAGRDVHVLAPTLFALLAWNVAVILGGLVVRLVAPGRVGRLPDAWLRSRLARLVPAEPPAEDRVGRIRRRFLTGWLETALPLGRARVRTLLHLGALCAVAGVVAGMYTRGLVLEYRASWESTFLDGSAVDRVAGTVLGPAAALLGRDVPPAGDLERPASGPAGPWIHLWATTAGLVVGVPRTLLLAEAVLRTRRLERRLPVAVPGVWVERIRAVGRSTALRVVVRPYSFDPSETAWGALRHLVLDLAGPRSEIVRRRALEYGAEAPEREGDLEIVVLPLAQTPEVEVHGELLGEVLRAAADGGGAALAVVDTSSFRRRLAGGQDVERRLEERRRAWSRVAAAAGLPAVTVDLERAKPEELETLARESVRPEGALA